jgi:isopentenyl-diphosphate delta-isomerase
VAEEIKKRKTDHIKIALRNDVQARQVTTGFEDVHFVHRALPEIDREEIDLETTVFGYKFAAPMIVGAITGGTAEGLKINATLAEAVEELQLGMGVGSQRAAIEDKSIEKTFSVARTRAPSAFLIANIGAVQLANGYGRKEAKKVIEILGADALALHLNALQEAVQPEGQTNFRGILPKLREIIKVIEEPVLVKETGAGIAAEDAKALELAGVKGIDVSGAGGTSWAAVEYYRASRRTNVPLRRLGSAFWDWGIPTAASVIEVAQTVRIPTIASGGVRDGIEMAKAIALGASLVSLSYPMLKTAVQGVNATKRSLSLLMDELRTTMFLIGARTIEDLKKTRVVVTGKTAEWLKMRGFTLEDYARRTGD